MNKIKSMLKALKKDQRGVSTLEYALLAVGALALGVFAWNSIGISTTQRLTNTATDISNGGGIPTVTATQIAAPAGG